MRLIRCVAWAGGALGVLVVAALFWMSTWGEQLVCRESVVASDAILVENFDPSYLVFERAAELQAAGLATRVFVSTNTGTVPGEPNLVSEGIVELMARVARLKEPHTVPINIVEPISLNAAYQIRKVLEAGGVRSVIVVAPAFRSRRSSLIYSAVFGRVGISTTCVPVFGQHTPANWTHTWHGIQEVAEQYVKLLYYRAYVLPGVKAKPSEAALHGG